MKDNNKEPIQIPIENYIDLHTFSPKEVRDVVEDYLYACQEKQIYNVRIIHGKGTGLLRHKVHKFLKSSPIVHSFFLAPPNDGFWGATIVYLKKDNKN